MWREFRMRSTKKDDRSAGTDWIWMWDFDTQKSGSDISHINFHHLTSKLLDIKSLHIIYWNDTSAHISNELPGFSIHVRSLFPLFLFRAIRSQKSEASSHLSQHTESWGGDSIILKYFRVSLESALVAVREMSTMSRIPKRSGEEEGKEKKGWNQMFDVSQCEWEKNLKMISFFFISPTLLSAPFFHFSAGVFTTHWKNQYLNWKFSCSCGQSEDWRIVCVTKKLFFSPHFEIFRYVSCVFLFRWRRWWCRRQTLEIAWTLITRRNNSTGENLVDKLF